MDKLYKINDQLAKIWKLGKLQIFVYPMICFGLLACGIIFMALVQWINNSWQGF